MDSQLATLNQQQAIRRLAFAMLNCEQPEHEILHHFAPGVYVRELRVKSGAVIVGKIHRFESINIVVKGRALVACNGETKEISAPCTFVSGAGQQKAVVVLEDMIWMNVHPTTETDVAKIEEHFIVRDDEFEAARLKAGVGQQSLETKE